MEIQCIFKIYWWNPYHWMKLGSPKATFYTADHWPYRRLCAPQIILSISSPQVDIFPPRIGSQGACGDRHENRPCYIKTTVAHLPTWQHHKHGHEAIHFISPTAICWMSLHHVLISLWGVSETSKVDPVFQLVKWLWCGPYYLHCKLCVPFRRLSDACRRFCSAFTQMCVVPPLSTPIGFLDSLISVTVKKYNWLADFIIVS